MRTVGMQVVDARVFRARERARGGEIDAIVGAFGRAAARVLPAVRDWTFAAGEADWRTKRAETGPVIER